MERDGIGLRRQSKGTEPVIRAPIVSVILASFNRRDVVLDTVRLTRERLSGLQRVEVIVVDNASDDGTADALHRLPGVRVIALRENLGSCAKALGVDQARAPFLLLLDDDSRPSPGSVERMLDLFDENESLAAAGFTVRLPDGREECSALPHVFVGCGVGLRVAAVREVGGLDTSLFMAAEEYDLAFRLVQAGWASVVHGDLRVEHLKSPQARASERITFLDIRNNVRIAARYLPDEPFELYRDFWTDRYRWLAEANGHEEAFERGLREGLRTAPRERHRYRRWRLGPEAFEAFFRWNEIESRFAALAAAGVRRVLLADLSKNLLAFLRGAERAGVNVLGILDERLHAPSRAVRGIPILRGDEAARCDADAFVVSNTSYVHARARAERLATLTSAPVCVWFAEPCPGFSAARVASSR